jgi:hypothetical protein
MAQRGIQIGQVATDAEARKLDTQCKTISLWIFERLKEIHGDRIKFQRKLKQDQIPNNKTGGCEPDGGLWFWDGVLIAVFEAKKQQNKGNAIERWYKNQYICRKINPNVSYATFVCGEGAVVGGVIHKALDVAHGEFNTYVPGGNSCWMKPEGFTENDIEVRMLEVLEERITSQSI